MASKWIREHQCEIDGIYTPLSLAAKEGNTTVVKHLLAAKADVNECNHTWSKNPLYLASMKGEDKVVKLLLEHGADIHAKSEVLGANTAFATALANKHTKVIRLLLDHGANPNEVSSGPGRSPALMKVLVHDDLVRTLLEKGADPNVPNNTGDTPVMFTQKYNSMKTAKLLLDHGAKVTHRNDDERTALHFAVYPNVRENAKLTKLFLDHGANVNHQDKEANTALHYAARNGHRQSVRVLLKHGADPNITGEYGFTALDEAYWKKDGRIIGLLKYRTKKNKNIGARCSKSRKTRRLA